MIRQTRGAGLGLNTDFYEFPMAGTLTKEMRTHRASFTLFFREVPEGGAYAVLCGIESALSHLQHLRFDDDDIAYLRTRHLPEDLLEDLARYRFDGDVTYVPEGTCVYPNTPLITVHADLMGCLLVETALLECVNREARVATKASRVVLEANRFGAPVSDMSARRDGLVDGALSAARSTYIAGFAATAHTLAGKEYGIDVMGTISHAFVMLFDHEIDAFRTWCANNPQNAILLIDTYDVERGCKHAIQVFDEMCERYGDDFGPYGVRIDSGDLAHLSRRVRAMLDDAGHEHARIVVSDGLDEYKIHALYENHAAIDSFGVGERVGCAAPDPVFGAVYKLVEIDGRPVVKLSENPAKTTNPGVCHLWRAKAGARTVDIVADETPVSTADGIPLIDSVTNETLTADPDTLRQLDVRVHIGPGTDTCLPTLSEVRAHCREELAALDPKERRLDTPARHIVAYTPAYKKKRDALIRNAREGLA